MNIAIIDSDLIYIKNHRFPNLACTKLSGYYKSQGCNVELKLDYNNLDKYDIVFISKVFTSTIVPNDVLKLDNVKYGGTGFFYDNASPLPYEIEHCMPDYSLYDDFIASKITKESDKKKYKYYTDYSIGFLTRGCFRHCSFCVNKNYDRVFLNSRLEEFYNPNRPKICLLDDNFLGYSDWKILLNDLQSTSRKFQFKQGLDERILTDNKAKELFNSKYDGDYIFAFDNIEDKDIIEEKAQLIKKYNITKGQNVKFYILCAYDKNNKYDIDFWKDDIKNTFDRIFTLSKYNFKPYIMRYEKYKQSPLYGTYVNLACWCNQPFLFNNLSYYDFCIKDDLRKSNGNKTSATWRYYDELLNIFPDIEHYLNIIPKHTLIKEW